MASKLDSSENFSFSISRFASSSTLATGNGNRFSCSIVVGSRLYASTGGLVSTIGNVAGNASGAFGSIVVGSTLVSSTGRLVSIFSVVSSIGKVVDNASGCNSFVIFFFVNRLCSGNTTLSNKCSNAFFFICSGSNIRYIFCISYVELKTLILYGITKSLFTFFVFSIFYEVCHPFVFSQFFYFYVIFAHPGSFLL